MREPVRVQLSVSVAAWPGLEASVDRARRDQRDSGVCHVTRPRQRDTAACHVSPDPAIPGNSGHGEMHAQIIIITQTRLSTQHGERVQLIVH